MKLKDASITTREKENLSKNFQAIDLRIGAYFSSLTKHQKTRFKRIEGSLARKLGLKLNQSPIEMILVRQIALNTVRIEEAELDIINNKEEEYGKKIEDWLFRAQRERREAISTLTTITKVSKTKTGENKFGIFREVFRDNEKLKKSKKTEIQPDGHDRRYRDNVVRTE